jgi:hypothetical protein
MHGSPIFSCKASLFALSIHTAQHAYSYDAHVATRAVGGGLNPSMRDQQQQYAFASSSHIYVLWA